MRAIARYYSIALILVVLSLPACQTIRGARLETGQRITEAEILIKSMYTSADYLKSLRARGSVDMREGSKRFKAHVIYVVKQSDMFRIECASFFDQPLSILVSNSTHFSLWDMNKGRFIRGKSNQGYFRKIIPFPLNEHQVQSLLVGIPLFIPYSHATLTWDKTYGLYRLQLTNGDKRQIMLIHPVLLRPVEVEIYNAKKLVSRLEYDNWIKKNNVVVSPKKIRVQVPAAQIKLIIRIHETILNPKLKNSLFELSPPPGIPIEIVK